MQVIGAHRQGLDGKAHVNQKQVQTVPIGDQPLRVCWNHAQAGQTYRMRWWRMLEHPLLGLIVEETAKTLLQDPDTLPQPGMILQVLRTTNTRPPKQSLIIFDPGIQVQNGQVVEILIAGLDLMRVQVAEWGLPWALKSQDFMEIIGKNPVSQAEEHQHQIIGGVQEQETVVLITDQKGSPLPTTLRGGNTIIVELS